MSTLTNRKTMKRRKLLKQGESIGKVVSNLWHGIDFTMVITTGVILVALAAAPLALTAVLRDLL
jgi:hypothetical protein